MRNVRNHSTTRTAVGLTAAALVVVAATACSSAQNEEPDPDIPATSKTTTATRSTPGDQDSSTSETPSETPTETPSEEPVDRAPLLSVSILGEEVLPNAEQIDLDAGKTMLVAVESDRAGELHVHSKPEQFLEFGEGTTNTELTVDTPGTVEIEDHDTGAVVAVLEIR